MNLVRLILYCFILYFSFFANISFAAKGQDVLIIHSYHDKHVWTAFLNEGFNNAFQNNKDIRLFHEYLDAKRYPVNDAYKKLFLSYLKNKYKSGNLSAIVVSDDAALLLIKEQKKHFLPGIPIIYLGINKVDQSLINTPNMTGVFENRDIGQAVLDIKKITGEDKIIIITDKSTPGRSNVAKIQSIENHPDAPTDIQIIDDLKDNRIASIFESVDNKTPILLIGQLTSTQHNNALLNWNDGTAEIASWIKNPIFTIAITTLERGAVGAYELSGVQHAEEASKLLKRVLEGEKTSNIKPITIAHSQWIFSWKGIEERSINHKNLPKKSIFIHKNLSFYQEYKTIVWLTCSAFFISFLLIIMLIEINRRGRNTRRILAENERRYKDLAHAGANIFWEMDERQIFSYISGNADIIPGLKYEDLANKKFSFFFKKENVIDFPENHFNKCFQEKLPLNNLIFKIKQNSKNVKVILINGIPIYDDTYNFTGYRGIVKEITQEHQLTQKLVYQATYDPLTGLLNRASFNLHLEETVNKNTRENQQTYLCFLDLDRFKLVNDIAGHFVGDAILAKIADVISLEINTSDIFARLGGDEFGLLITNKNQKEAQILCESIIVAVNNFQYQWHQRYFNVGISIGMVPIKGQFSAIELFSKADLSCYKAKETGRNRVFIAGPDNKDLYIEELQIGYIANISQVIENNQFYMAKQLIKPLGASSSIEHYELLLRYQDIKGQHISPALFIPAAEKYGVIGMIDEWVVTNIFNHYSKYFPLNDTLVSINLSGMTLSNNEFIEKIKKLVISSAIEKKNICFEITETAAISQLSQVLDFMHDMKALGVKFALDDFGSGTASFGYLKDLPVDYLKIDGSLIKNIVTEPTDRAIIESIHSIAKIMGMKTIAEFVENQEIEDILLSIGIDYVQGYHIGKPRKCL